MARSDPLHPLGARERQIMEILLRRGRATAAEVQDELDADLSNASVRGMLRLLVSKGLAAYDQEGNRYVYRPLLRPQQTRRNALSHLVGTFFKGSPSSAIAALLDMQRQPLSDEEYERLSALLAKARAARSDR